jgi:hypothetical protein
MPEWQVTFLQAGIVVGAGLFIGASAASGLCEIVGKVGALAAKVAKASATLAADLAGIAWRAIRGRWL